MSEPLSAVEIEDVLSSIRRLVSEDLRPAPRAPADAAPAPGTDKPRPALILTPALRVVPEAEPAAPAVPIRQVVASVGAAVPSNGQDWEPETGDPQLTEDRSWPESDWEDVEAGELRQAEAAVPPVTDGAADFGPDATAPEPAPVIEDAEWLAAAEAEVIAGLEQPEADDFDAFAPSGEMSFDEEVLRDLVRDLIREELQGHLGERITRNIRKLVRAEIARALAAAELE